MSLGYEPPACGRCGDRGPVVYEMGDEAICIACAVAELWAVYHGVEIEEQVTIEFE